MLKGLFCCIMEKPRARLSFSHGYPQNKIVSEILAEEEYLLLGMKRGRKAMS